MKSRCGAQLWLFPLLLTLVTAAVVFWPALGYSSLSQSEGHRAITGWQMLDSGQFLLPRLFDHLYLRKPPGMPWAVALLSSILGQTEFAARAVSALASTLAACLSCLAACRWFGRVPGMVAGVSFALTPLFLYPGRSAEIEALNNFFCLASMLASISMVAAGRSGRAYAAAACAGLATACMMLTKGPAGLPCTFAAVIAAAWAFGRVRAALLAPAFWLSLVIPAAIFGGYLLAAKTEFARLAEPAILEPPSHFLWNPSKLGEIFMLPLAAVASAFPQGLALLYAMRRSPRLHVGTPYAAAVVGACVGALIIYTVAGVANPRYAMPALTLLPLCCGVMAWQMEREPRMTVRVRRWWARAGVLSAVVLLVVAVGQAGWLEYRREFRTGGRTPAQELAAHVPDGAQVYAFEMIDQRPELLEYVKRAVEARGGRVHVRWQPYPAVLGRDGPPVLPPVGGFVLMRKDQMRRDQYPPEWSEYLKYGLDAQLGMPLYEGRVHNFMFALYQVQ